MTDHQTCSVYVVTVYAETRSLSHCHPNSQYPSYHVASDHYYCALTDLLDICRRWSREREQWGQAIGKHEAIAGKLAELSRRTGVHVVAPTGLHHDRYYGPSHWSHRSNGSNRSHG